MEVKILEHLTKRDKESNHNVVNMIDYFYFRNHLCITFELLGMNLYELIKKNSYQGFSINLIKKFAGSLVHCLRLLYREQIIHCDLKPVSTVRHCALYIATSNVRNSKTACANNVTRTYGSQQYSETIAVRVCV